MTKAHIIRKLTSRKFWRAAAALISGLIVAFGETAETAETVAGLIISGAMLQGDLRAEGLTDAAAAGGTTILQLGDGEIIEERPEDKE